MPTQRPGAPAYSAMFPLSPDEPAAAPPARTRIVGLGSSAGGLAALEQFLAHVPAHSGLAYVVVQHLDPTQKAMLAELLQRATPMPVVEVTEAMPVRADSVYVIPPNSELTVSGGLLRLAPPAQPRGLRLPVDVLFASLARDQGDRAVGVVLSGMGADGAIGLQSIRQQGGLGCAQQPESAQFDAMPRNAIATGAADIVDTPAALPQRILLVTAARAATAGPDVDDGRLMAPILELLRERSRHDLSAYKPSTLRRRIERRMGVHGTATLAAYEDLLRHNPQELDLLFKEMLIGVTSFFRDTEVWQTLKDTVLPTLLARGGAGQRLRAWVAGCSTGEEAYSLAMVFKEVCAEQPAGSTAATAAASSTLQIFATDLSADAIARGRRGHYATGSMQAVSPERRARFFSAQGSGWLVAEELRDMVLFAQHDVILDPPFTRLDILTCRNLMIYFSTPLQRRLLPLFHYSLRPGGVLVLGGSETVGNSQALFAPLSPKSRLYWRSDNALSARAVEFPIKRRPMPRTAAPESTVPPPISPPVNLQSLADQVLLQEYAPPAVLVNDQGDILYVTGRTGRYLEAAAGKANWNIHVMARPGIRIQVAAALRQAVQDKKTVELQGLHLDDDPLRALDITVQALQHPKALEGTVLIVFRDQPAAAKAQRRKGKPAAGPAAAAAAERAHEEVLALRQEMRVSQEELQAANEELQSTNEELQSANEELTTSKEEAQSMNEELQTLNGELQSKLDDLALAQSDMQNLLNSTDIATLFLDNLLNVRRFTEQIVRIFHLREGDIGRPLSDLASTLLYPQLHDDAKETLRTLTFSEKEIATNDGHWFLVRIKPYRTLANVIQGVVITFVDITAAKALESRLRQV
jgi:two-component system CheB/CheR fusion protein